MEPHDLIVLTPTGGADPSLAIAACRAGAWGVLDLEHTSPLAARPALVRLARFTTGFGLGVGSVIGCSAAFGAAVSVGCSFGASLFVGSAFGAPVVVGCGLGSGLNASRRSSATVAPNSAGA